MSLDVAMPRPARPPWLPVHPRRALSLRRHRLLGRPPAAHVLGRCGSARQADLLHAERLAAGHGRGLPRPAKNLARLARALPPGRGRPHARVPLAALPSRRPPPPPGALFDPFRASSARLQLLFPISLGNIWDFPYAELRPTIVELVDTLGSDRLIYGTDMPNVERFCNYRQTLDTFRVHCRGLIPDEDIANIIGGTAARLFGLGA